ncbi:DRC11 protein, partial [Crypturellus undulatus]|nr:DRC11 protein [Crypturellus undulatus]
FPISTYNKLWADAQESLDVLLQGEREVKPIKDHVTAFKALATSYIKYVQVFRNLDTAYEQIVHPQKRLAIRQVLEGVMGRILELKNDMVTLENSEYHYFDDILQDLKLLPEHIEIPIPKYFIKENRKVLQEREKLLAEILVNAGFQTQEPVKSMDFEEAIKMIQVAERARQGRLRATFMKQIYLEEKRERQAKLQGKTGPNPDDAVACIQKIWRGYIQCKKTEKIGEEEMIFLGMVSDNNLENIKYYNSAIQIFTVSTSMLRAREVNTLRGEVQQRHENDYQKALVHTKDTLKQTEGLDIKESLQDQIRQCFIECRNIIGKFPDYPTEEAGGSTATFSQKTPHQVDEELTAKEEAALQKKPKKDKEKEKEKEKGKGKEKKKEEKQKTEKKEEGWKMAPSNFLPVMEEGSSQYNAVWNNRDEGWNFLQERDPELIKQEKREEVEKEIRVQVDEVMRQEVKNLKLVVDKEQSDEQKKGKKIEKVRFPRISELSLVHRTIDSLYKELAERGLLIKAKTVNLSDYVGKYSYLGTALRQADVEPMPSLSDVRQLIALYGILPLGSQAVHEKAPLVKAMLLAGPAGVGKKMLVHAICTETGANLFNLSASNIAGKYPGSSGLQMMLHLVYKVAKQLQPSVVWIGDAEKTFYKKVPKAEKEIDPKRLKRILPTFLKLLKAEDRVLLVGTTRRPFDADLRPFCKVYQKIILIPRPDYASRFGKYFKSPSLIITILWKHIIMQNGGVVTKTLNLSCLAKLSDGFTQGHIFQSVQTVLSERRMLQMTKKPLRAVEFMTSLARQDPVYKEEEETFK